MKFLSGSTSTRWRGPAKNTHSQRAVPAETKRRRRRRQYTCTNPPRAAEGQQCEFDPDLIRCPTSRRDRPLSSPWCGRHSGWTDAESGCVVCRGGRGPRKCKPANPVTVHHDFRRGPTRVVDGFCCRRDKARVVEQWPGSNGTDRRGIPLRSGWFGTQPLDTTAPPFYPGHGNGNGFP